MIPPMVGVLIIPLLLGLALYVVMKSAVVAPGKSLGAKFGALGMLKGRKESEIVAAVGPPTSRSGLAGGKYLLQWQATGYHIALRFFDDGTCDGVTHEHRAR